MPVTWFPVDSNSPNDPKIKAICRQGGQAWAGATWLLWCFIGSHGKSEPGLGVRADFTPLPKQDLADECLFRSVDDAVVFLDYVAERNHIHRQLWQDKGIVFIPAMWTRLIHYAKSKGRNASQYADAQALAAAVLSGSYAAPAGTGGPSRGPAGHGGPAKPLQTNRQTNRHTDKRRNTGAAKDAALPGIPASDPKAHPIKAVLAFHDALFLKATGHPYPNYTDGDCKNVGQMLKKTSQADLQAEIEFMFQCPDEWVQQCGFTIGAFQKLRPKLTVLRTKQPAGAAPDPAKGRTGAEAGKYADLG